MIRRNLALSCLLVLLGIKAHTQDRQYVRQLVSKLSAPEMHGRGYVKNGDLKAATLLEREMKSAGLLAFDNHYVQQYAFPINTFPGKLEVRVNGKKLRPGYDYVLSLKAVSMDETFNLLWLPDTVTSIASAKAAIDTSLLASHLVVAPACLKNVYRSGFPGARGIIQLTPDNVWWHVSGAQSPDGSIALMVQENSLPKGTTTIKLKVEHEFIKKHEARNLVGYVKGSAEPDSFFVFVAHYDHLGRMGAKTYFPGASDNASGTAAVMDMARYYAAHPEQAYYSMVFIFVSGEEAGLLGSTYNAENPLFPLENVKFLINMDMVGTGSEGLSVVNGLQFPQALALLEDLNANGHYFANIRAGGESCNSDHCPYYKKGVPSFFVFTRGDENHEYHNVYDTDYRLPFTAYEQFFKLMVDFAKAIAPVNKAM